MSSFHIFHLLFIALLCESLHFDDSGTKNGGREYDDVFLCMHLIPAGCNWRLGKSAF